MPGVKVLIGRTEIDGRPAVLYVEEGDLLSTIHTSFDTEATYEERDTGYVKELQRMSMNAGMLK